MTERVELRTERLLLRPFELADVDDVLDYASDPEWARFLGKVPQPFTRRAAEERVARSVLESWETHPTWAIVLNRKVVGSIVLMMDAGNETAELGYELSREHWGKGLTVEASEAVIDWGFRERGLAKVFAQADARNERSLRAMEKLHMSREGVLRSQSTARGERVDDVHYGLLREEWEGHDRIGRSRNGFECAAKRRQQQFRAASPTISDKGRSPTDDKGRRYPHLLALGCEVENFFPGIRGEGGAIDFFSQRDIKWWKSSRSGDNSKSDGPTRNMASSQVACVNFLLPLAGIPGALLSVLRSLDDDVVDVVNISCDGHTSAVEFEWIGLGHSLERGRTRGSQNTSIDAFLVADTRKGRRRAYLLEWKYVERYLSTRPEFKGEGTKGDTRRCRYAKRFRASFSSFNPATAPDLDDFLYEPFYQIMRQRLLADRMVQERELGVDEAKVVVVVPEQNWAYRAVSDGRTTTSPLLAQRLPRLETVEDVMRASLKEPDAQFDMVAPSSFLDALSQRLPSETKEWAGYWQDRYGV